MNIYRAGIDIGSTTVKLAVLDDQNRLLFSSYERHHAKIQPVLARLLRQAGRSLGNCLLKPAMTGSGGLSLAKALDLEFVQEVAAVAAALQQFAPGCDTAIELGGEDAKIIYFTGGLDERMNGVCAGGTGSFIDQMASLLQSDAAGLNELAKGSREIYPIAARCGVFAKSDIQPLINEGASREDLAASIFQAVVNQTISGLACGKPIKGRVAFLGGPLHYLDELRHAFEKSLNLGEQESIHPDDSHLFAAMGAALSLSRTRTLSAEVLAARLEKGLQLEQELKRLDPLFKNQEEYDDFVCRHSKAAVEKADIKDISGPCFLGIDAGSTTTKAALIDEYGRLVYSFYSSNLSSPIETARKALKELHTLMPEGSWIARACSTGYGEALLKTAFCLDEGEVETIAHTTAASFFDPLTDCVLDIGGQDMKCIRLKDGCIDTIMLNEACSSGCGSFIENFASSLGLSAAEFADQALFANNPLDLGTRCTVFMNSNVKQAQKEGADVRDISAGLAYSVIKNALYKVIRLSDPKELGSRVVVQGGTFFNQAILRAFEKITGLEATCPDIAGMMGAFGAALIAKERWNGEESSMLSFEEIEQLEYVSNPARCKGCANQCRLSVTVFKDRRHVTGNRCEKGAGKAGAKKDVPDLYAYKLKRLFQPEPGPAHPKGIIGIPRVLNMYEHYPFWQAFFHTLGFDVLLSPLSTKEIYESGMTSIPSETECFPAKLSHGHIEWLIQNGAETIFYPCIFYERKENPKAQNHFSCPVVISYPENIKNNMEAILENRVEFLRPFIAFTNEKTIESRMVPFAAEHWSIHPSLTRQAVQAGWKALQQAKEDIRSEGKKALAWMEENEKSGIVLAGRPYHTDPLINHGIPEMITSYSIAVLSEDSLPVDAACHQTIRVNDQWTYHSRLYAAAEFASRRNDLELVQLNSFGCGLDAVTVDQVQEILESHGKLHTVLKIDEVSSLGAARIRIRSLIAAMRLRNERGILSHPAAQSYSRSVFTKEMKKEGWTILAPQMSPLHFDFLIEVFRKHGFNMVLLDNDNKSAIDAGLKYVNNDACFPSITVIGQIMEAVTSSRYDTDHLAIIMSQTGGCCRASNYIAFIRRALKKAGLEHIPVISLNTAGLEKNPGFKIPPACWIQLGQGLVLGDLLMRCLYRVRPYEKASGAANELYQTLHDECLNFLAGDGSPAGYAKLCQRIVSAFDELEIYDNVKKPRVGIVGEILVKYMPLANNHLVELLESEGVEAVVPDLLDFLNYCLVNQDYKHAYLGKSAAAALAGKLGLAGLKFLRTPAIKALEQSRRFAPPADILQVAKATKPYLSLGNQYGEGWFLTGEMLELLESGVDNIVCIQPFGCLPNHVVGKGTIRKIKMEHEKANIVALDYDPGASAVNQLNRIKLMLSAARRNMDQDNSVSSFPDNKTRPVKWKLARSNA